jgi:antitoxin component of MazEF toxin-antitoxin module
MLHKVLKIGNSYGVTFPRDFVVRNKIKAGIQVDSSGANGSITFSTKLPKNTGYEAISDQEFFKLAKEVDQKYKSALDELANLP